MELQQMSITLRDAMHEARAIASKLETLAHDWALAEKEYQVAKTREVMGLKDGGMAVTLINETVRGVEHIAELKYKRDLAAEVLKANHRLLQVLGDSMSASQSLLRYQSEV